MKMVRSEGNLLQILIKNFMASISYLFALNCDKCLRKEIKPKMVLVCATMIMSLCNHIIFMSSGNYLDICSLDTLYPNIIICFKIGKNESISVINNVNPKIDY